MRIAYAVHPDAPLSGGGLPAPGHEPQLSTARCMSSNGGEPGAGLCPRWCDVKITASVPASWHVACCWSSSLSDNFSGMVRALCARSPGVALLAVGGAADGQPDAGDDKAGPQAASGIAVDGDCTGCSCGVARRRGAGPVRADAPEPGRKWRGDH